MELNEYQKQAMSTCMESSNNVAYMFLNLAGELGELAEKMAEGVTDKRWEKKLQKLGKMLGELGAIGKRIRKEPYSLTAADIRTAFYRLTYQPVESKDDFKMEIGDIMWQLNGLMTVLDMSAEDVARQNLEKLASRKERGVIDGEGDNR